MADQHIPKDDRGYISYDWDFDEDVFKVALLVYNPNTLAWERMKQPSIDIGDLTVSMGDVEKLLSNNYWKDTRVTYTSGNPIYKGLNVTHKAATDSATWYIWKFTWSGSDCTRIEGPLVGTWDGRAALAWA